MMVKWRKSHLLILCFFGFALALQSSPKTPLYTDQECLACHGDINLAQVLNDGTIRSLYVDPEAWTQDVHKMGDLLCVDCHTHANPYVHFREGFLDVDCAKCHPEQSEEYLKNVHFESIPQSHRSDFHNYCIRWGVQILSHEDIALSRLF